MPEATLAISPKKKSGAAAPGTNGARRSPSTPEKLKAARKRHVPPVGEDRRAHILAAAQRVFEAKGLEGANMRAIAKEAGYTPGALYFYYKSQEEIYADLLTTSLWRLKDYTHDAARDARTPGEQLRTRALAFYDYYATRPDEMSLGFYLHKGLGPHGLTHTLDERLNAQFWMTLIGVLDPLIALGRTQAEAVRELAAIVAHGVGLLLLLHTGRIRLFHQDGRELFRVFVENSVQSRNCPQIPQISAD